MGYTHYWTLKRGANDPVRFKEAVDLFKECWERAQKTFSYVVWDKKTESWKKKRFKKENLLKGWDGTGEAIISEDKICFNGNRRYGLDHETFRIYLADFNDTEGWNIGKNGEIHDFCKTARKPYDLAVCLALLSFKEVFGDDFEYSSDGVTRESISKPENRTYWESIDWDPKIEDEWKRAYRVWDDVMLERHLAAMMAR